MGRVNGHYSGEGGMGKLNRVSDDGNKAQHDQSVKYGNEFKQACAQWEEKTWMPGPLTSHGRDGAPSHDSYNTKPVSAASPTGRYAKKGGSGQRSGA